MSQRTRCGDLKATCRSKGLGETRSATELDLKEAFLRNDCAEWDHGIRRNSLTAQFHDIKESGRYNASASFQGTLRRSRSIVLYFGEAQ